MTPTAEFQELLQAAKAALKAHDFPRATELFRQATELDKLCLEAFEGLAIAAYSQKEFPAAAAAFTRLTQLKPMDAKSWVNLGAVYNRMHEYQKAADACRKAMQRDKRSVEAQYNLGVAYKGLNQPSMAASAYREALKLNPQMAEAHANLANLLVDMKNYQQAILHYRQALEIDPQFERARRGLEFAEHEADEAKKATSPFGRLVDEKTAGRVATHAMVRTLTEAERIEDRDRLFQLSPEIEAAATQLYVHLRDDLERRFLALNRTVASGEEGRAALIQAVDDFRMSVRRFDELRRSLKRKILELRAHEELVCMPSLNS